MSMARTSIVLDDFILLKARQAAHGNLSRFIEQLLLKSLSKNEESMYGAFSRTKLSTSGLREKKDRVDEW